MRILNGAPERSKFSNRNAPLWTSSKRAPPAMASGIAFLSSNRKTVIAAGKRIDRKILGALRLEPVKRCVGGKLLVEARLAYLEREQRGDAISPEAALYAQDGGEQPDRLRANSEHLDEIVGVRHAIEPTLPIRPGKVLARSIDQQSAQIRLDGIGKSSIRKAVALRIDIPVGRLTESRLIEKVAAAGNLIGNPEHRGEILTGKPNVINRGLALLERRFARNAEILPQFIVPVAALRRRYDQIRALWAGEAVAIHDELVALRLTPRQRVIFQQQTVLPGLGIP